MSVPVVLSRLGSDEMKWDDPENPPPAGGDDRKDWFYRASKWLGESKTREYDRYITFEGKLEELGMVKKGGDIFWGTDPVLEVSVVSPWPQSVEQEPFKRGNTSAVGDSTRTVYIPNERFKECTDERYALQCDTKYHFFTTVHHQTERIAFIIPDNRDDLVCRPW